MEGFSMGSKTEGKTMKRSLFVCMAALALLTVRAQAQDFTLSFEAPETVYGAPGETVIIDVTATLISNVVTEVGAEGWQVSLTAENALIRIRDQNGNLAADPADDKNSNAKYMTRGFPLETMFDDDEDAGTPPIQETFDLDDAGFNNTGIGSSNYQDSTLPPDVTGVVSAVVLTELGSAAGRALIPVGTIPLAKLTLQATVPADGCDTVTLKYLSGLKASGQPVDNVITYQSGSIDPVLEEKVIQVCVPPAFFDLAIVLPGQDPSAATDFGNSEPEPVLVPAGMPSIHELDVILTTSGLPDVIGPEGWQLSLAYDPAEATMRYWDTDDPGRVIPGDVVDIRGRAKNMSKGFDILTLYDDDEDPGTPAVDDTIDMGDSGFNQTSAATSDYQDSTLPAGLDGLTSAVVLTELGSAAARSLKGNTRTVLLKLLIEMPPVSDDETASCTIYFLDNMKGSGQPVANVITYKSGSKTPTKMQGLVLKVAPVKQGLFIRGDGNDDGQIDIADAITIIYDPRVVPGLMGTQIPCMDAGDANDDEDLTLADAVYLINWQFALTDPAPAPVPPNECGTDDDATLQSCPANSMKFCSP